MKFRQIKLLLRFALIIIAFALPFFLVKNVVGATPSIIIPSFRLTLTPPITPPPTPITPPLSNTNPEIITESLPVGFVRHFYSASIQAIDRDSDKVNLSVSNPPLGMRSSCQAGRASSTCTIFGVPRNTGSYMIRTRAVDSRGGETTKNYLLVIKNW